MRILIVTLLGLGLAGCQKTDTATPGDATPTIATAPAPASEPSEPPYLDDEERASRRPATPSTYDEEVSDEDDYDDEDYADEPYEEADEADEADVSYDDYEDEDPDESYESSDPY